MEKRLTNEINDNDIVCLFVNGGSDAKLATTLLVEKYQDYVHFIIKSFFPSYAVNNDDMFQCGVVGLLKALRTYDPGKSKFTTHCVPFVRKECISQIRFESGEGSEYYHAVHSAVEKAKSKLEAKGKEATVEEVMRLTNLSEKIVRRELGIGYEKASYEAVSNSEPEDPNESVSAGSIDEILGGLPENLRKIVTRHVINGEDFADIAKSLHRSTYVVTQDYKEAIEILRSQINV